MNIAEMHIAINLGVQKIASNQVDVLLPEEIDLELNKNIERFVSQRFNKLGNKYGTGVEESQKRIDDLRTLVTEFSADTTFKGQISNKHFIDSFALPGAGTLGGPTGLIPGLLEYRHLLNARSLIFYENCKPIETTTIMGGTGSLDYATLEIVNGGSDYYATPLVTFPPPSNGGVTATGICTIDGGGTLTDITLTDMGSGYSLADFPLNITITSPPAPIMFTKAVLYSPGVNVMTIQDPLFVMGNILLGYGVRATDPPSPPSMLFSTIFETFVQSLGGVQQFLLNTPPIGVASTSSGTIEITDYSAIISPAVAAVSGLVETRGKWNNNRNDRRGYKYKNCRFRFFSNCICS